MQLIKPGTNINFIRLSSRAWLVSAAIALVGIASLVIRGPNYGIDFAGGLMVHVRFAEPQRIGNIRAALRNIGLAESSIQDFGPGGREFLVRMPVKSKETMTASAKLTGALHKRFGEDTFEVLRVEIVGPRVGAELRERAVLAVAFATIMIAIFIWVRFELRFGIGAAAALVHDVALTIGALSLARYELDLPVVAALLTVVGYSVNDTVVVSDRIRENMRKNRRDPLSLIINRSINETLSRTLLTSGTSLFVVLALYFLGGRVIHPFAFALLVGVIVGTYSSIYIAMPLVLTLEHVPGMRRRR